MVFLDPGFDFVFRFQVLLIRSSKTTITDRKTRTGFRSMQAFHNGLHLDLLETGCKLF